MRCKVKRDVDLFVKEPIMIETQAEEQIASFPKIILRIKTHMLKKQGKVIGKIFDKEVAKELGILYTTFRYYKGTNQSPLKEVCDFCMREEIEITTLIKN